MSELQDLPADLPVPVDDGGADHLLGLKLGATMILRAGVVRHVMYPVFPPDRNAADVEAWLAR